MLNCVLPLIKHGFDGYKVGTFGEDLKLFWPKP